MTGSLNENSAPPPGTLAAQIFPLCCSMIDRLIASPIPNPLALVVTNGLNRLSITESSMPGPVSRTATVTELFSTDSRISTPSFRNWDLPERRQLFAGLRLASDPGES